MSFQRDTMSALRKWNAQKLAENPELDEELRQCEMVIEMALGIPWSRQNGIAERVDRSFTKAREIHLRIMKGEIQ